MSPRGGFRRVVWCTQSSTAINREIAMHPSRSVSPREGFRRITMCLALLWSGFAAGQAGAAAPVLAGKTACPYGASDCNPCVANVVDAMNRLRTHGDVLGYRMNGAADVTSFNHWQGVQRLMTHGGRYLAISRSVEDADVGFVVVEMGSRDGSGARFRSNRLQPNVTALVTPPPAEDGVVVQVPRDPEFHHAGGIQALGNFLALPVERSDVINPVTGEIIAPGASKVLFYDMSDPLAPRRMATEVDHTLLADAAGAAFIARLADDRILVGIGRGDSTVLDFYVSSGSELETAVFEPFDEWGRGEARSDLPDGDDNFAAYQSINLVTQCDGTLFLVGTHENTAIGVGRDFADTFRLENGAGDDVVITKVARRHLRCEGQCNLDAAGGVYLDPEGQILVYGTEHDNDGPDGSVKFSEFRPVPHSGCDSIRDAWVELFVDNTFGGRSLMIDYVDRALRNYRDYDRAEAFGDAPSSAHFCLPSGATYRLWQHAGCEGGFRDLVGDGSFQSIVDFHALSFDDATSCSEWLGGPFADAGPDQIVECQGAATSAVVDGSGSSDVDGTGLAFHWTSAEATFASSIAPITTAHFLPGSATVTLAVDNGTDADTDEAVLRSQDTVPPVITCPAPASAECTALGGTPATDAGVQAFLTGAAAQDVCDTAVEITTDAPPFFPLGSTPVAFTVTDDANLSAACESTLTIVDTIGPAIDPAFALSPALLRVPDHQMVSITVAHLEAEDACQPEVQIECSVESNEPADAPSGDGHALPDMIFNGVPIAGTSSGFQPVATTGGTGSFSLALRAERSALGTGRVYTVACRAVDGAGNTGATRSAFVVVPRTARPVMEGPGTSGAAASAAVSASPVTPPAKAKPGRPDRIRRRPASR